MPKIRKNKKPLKKRIVSWCIAIALIGCLIIVIGLSANFGNKLTETNNFGIGSTKFSTDSQVGVIANNEYESIDKFQSSDTTLATYSTRDISSALTVISVQIEAAAKAAAEAAKAAEMIEANMAKNRRNEQVRKSGIPAELSNVNWDVGKAAFIAEWTSRINNYLAGSPLSGTGEIFATAAWENGIDPRWSPAISNTESTKGAYCFASHNAWGWGSSGWSSWEEAINAHVSGLARSYGYTITYAAAEKYCPPNCDHWYNATLNQMLLI